MNGEEKQKSLFAKIWNSPVFSGVIATAIWTIFVAVIQKINFIIEIFKKFSGSGIGSRILISLLLAFFIAVFYLLFYIRKIKRIHKSEIFELQEKESSLLKNIEVLNTRIHELEKPPANPRLNMFKSGDIVIMKLEKDEFISQEYSVIEIDKTNETVSVRDKDGNVKKFKPNELLTAIESVRAKENSSNSFNALLNPKTIWGI